MTTDADAPASGGPLLAPRARLALVAIAAIGLLAFVAGLAVDEGRAWTALLVNFLFWAGLSSAGVVLSAVFHLTSARWARPLERLAEATIAFLPVGAVMLGVLLAGGASWLPWMRGEPEPARQAWLNWPFFAGREAVGYLLLGLLGMAYVHASVRPDIGLLDPAVGRRRRSRLAPALLVVYAVVLSLQAFDFVMALDAHWYSTLLGGYFFVGNLYVGVAGLALAAVWLGAHPALGGAVTAAHRHDLGRMLLGFCLLWAYLFWAQYLVIWYGDLPEETAFVAHRTVDAPWAPLAWIVLAAAFAVPFLLLLSRDLKRHPRGLAAVAALSFVGMGLERGLLVAPSLWTGSSLPFGPVEVLVTAGSGALFVLAYTAFLERVPILRVSGPLFDAERAGPA